jgi:hypothetical protein
VASAECRNLLIRVGKFKEVKMLKLYTNIARELWNEAV